MCDLHLPFGRPKPRDIFGGWENYTERMEQNWNSIVGEDDCVVIPGDLCWAMSLEEALPDFEFVSKKLHGRKIISKGNHDYWWTTLNKMNSFLQSNDFHNIRIMHNNAFSECGIAICGTRGWINDDGAAQDAKVLFIHYPPIYGSEHNDYILDVMSRYPVKRCFYGHVHSAPCFPKAFQGVKDGITYRMVSADYVKFTPVLVQE